jgi:ketosteroid isomerase-like protein
MMNNHHFIILVAYMNTSNISAMLEKYCAAFRPCNAKSIAQFYHCPATVFSNGIMITLTSRADIENMLSAGLSALESRDFSQSIITSMHIHPFSDDVVLLSASFSRLSTKGDVLENIAATYTLFNAPEAGWKIATLIAHNTDRLIA